MPIGESRATVRKALDETLAEPVTTGEGEQGGSTAEAIQAAEQADAAFEQWSRLPVEGE